jgi:hypothetical protein
LAQRLDRRVLFLWWAIGALCTIGVAAAAVVVAQLGRPPRAWLALVAGLAGTLAAVIPPLRYRRWRHELRARDALLSKGGSSSCSC